MTLGSFFLFNIAVNAVFNENPLKEANATAPPIRQLNLRIHFNNRTVRSVERRNISTPQKRGGYSL